LVEAQEKSRMYPKRSHDRHLNWHCNGIDTKINYKKKKVKAELWPSLVVRRIRLVFSVWCDSELTNIKAKALAE
jgi:hypothetical protein